MRHINYTCSKKKKRNACKFHIESRLQISSGHSKAPLALATMKINAENETHTMCSLVTCAHRSRKYVRLTNENKLQLITHRCWIIFQVISILLLLRPKQIFSHRLYIQFVNTKNTAHNSLQTICQTVRHKHQISIPLKMCHIYTNF